MTFAKDDFGRKKALIVDEWIKRNGKSTQFQLIWKWLCVLLFILVFSGIVYAIPNPASVYCYDVGGTIEISKTPLGEQGLCVINVEKFDEWKFLEGKVGKEHSWCVKNGYGIETLCDGKSPFSSCRAVCVFQNESKRDMGYLMNLYEKIYGKKVDPDKREIKVNSFTITPKFTSGGGGKHIILQAQENAQANTEEDNLPNYFDWRNVNGTNFTTSVKDQEGGVCWAYAVVGTVEAKYNIEHNISDSSFHLNLSERNLASNNPECGCDFCGDYNGGSYQGSYFYIKKVGITTEECFPDIDNNSYPLCSERCSEWRKNLYKIKDYKVFSTTNRTYIKKMLIEKGPLTVSVNANWQNESDILYCDTNSTTNHDMILVGYNDTGQYWILKNSWGTNWPLGHKGYAYIKYGNVSCGIESNDQEFAYPENVSLVSFSNESNCKNFVTVCKNGTCDSKTIQEAVEAVCSGGKIFINDSSAVFNEEIDILMDNITLDCNSAIIDGNNTKDIGIWITAKNVTVKNCIIENFVDSGIWLYGASNNTIFNNIVNNNDWRGIYLRSSSNNIIINNAIKDSWGGIYLDSSSKNIVTNNTAKHNYRYGIYLYSSSNNTLTTNTAKNSHRYGIYLYSSSNNTLTTNTAKYNNYGIYLNSSSNNILNSNLLCSNSEKDIYNNETNTGDNNACNTTENWNDEGMTGCTYPCPCTCESCEECEAKLNDSNCQVVNLTTDITNYTGTCIYNPQNFTNKIFDCQWHTIDGSGSGYRAGIYLNNKTRNTIKNCVITDFYLGIYLDSSSNNTIINNTVNNNWYGIDLYSSSNNTLTNNIANNNNQSGIYLSYFSNYNAITHNIANNNNQSGIYLSYFSNYNAITHNTANNNNQSGIYLSYTSSNNILNMNHFCLNSQEDIYNDGLYNTGDNNTCNTTENWNDDDTIGCAYLCNSICTCGSCEKCTLMLDNPNCQVVILTMDIINDHGTCVDNPQNFNNKTFDCQGHKIDGNEWGHGIYLNEKYDNTIKNCVITDFYRGIYLDSSSNNTLIKNTVNNNKDGGIYLVDSSNNTITNNTANNNEGGIICLGQYSNNTIIYNTAKDNSFDIYVSPGPNAGCNNIIENNTGSGDRAIKYFNHSVTLQNETLSELILCNADNSNISNVTIAGSDNLKNNGMFVYLTYNSNFTDINSSDNMYGIFLYSSSNNLLINNTLNSNNHTGIYIYAISNFNKILGNKISNNGETGITLSNCSPWNVGWQVCYYMGNSNNSIEGNEILNNKIGIFSKASNSTINNNHVCENTQSDFNSTDWLSSSGDNNICDKPDKWNDTSAQNGGCENKCCEVLKDIFDAVEILEYLSFNGEKNSSNLPYCDLTKDNTINLLDIFTLMNKIVIEG